MADNQAPNGQTLGAYLQEETVGMLNVGKWGAIGALVALFLSKEPGRQLVENVTELSAAAFERLGIEANHVRRQVHEWTVETYQQMRAAVLYAFSLIIMASVMPLLAATYAPWGWVKGVVGVLGLSVVSYACFDLWFRWIPAVITVGLAVGAIDEAAAKTIRDLMNNPLSIFGIIKGGLKNVQPSIAWVFLLWKAMALIIIWYSVGVLYINFVPLYQTPSLIWMVLPTLPIFILVPLAEPWGRRGTQYTWIMWGSLFALINIAILAVFPDELYVPILDGSLMARILMMVVLGGQALYITYLSMRPVATSNGTEYGRMTGGPVFVEVGGNKRSTAASWYIAVTCGIGGIMILGWLCAQILTGWHISGFHQITSGLAYFFSH